MTFHTQTPPRLSIGMPVYNGEAYIREAIESLLAQTFTDFELVISDNASTDATPAICRTYADQDSRVRYLRQSSNLGAAQNFRFVLQAARESEYFMWAACDDTWSKNWIESLLTDFQSTDFGIFGGYREGSGAVIHPPSYLRGEYSQFFLDSDRTGKCLYSYAVFRRHVLLQSDMGFFDCPVGADQVYLLHLLSLGTLRCVPGGVLCYRIHDASVSATQSGARGRLKTVFSRYPFVHYLMAFDAVPSRLKPAMSLLIAWKYIKEQTTIMFGLVRSVLRRSRILFRVRHPS
jgi:glycosyltransferase involved in cell wall biosynthesis